MMVRNAMSARVPILRKLIERACKRDAQRREAKRRATKLEAA
jgi:hypothetical protein